MKLDSIVGTRVNRFTVEEKIRMPKATGGSGILYKCLCDCGKTFYLPSNDLQKHTPRDCGCGIRTPLPEEEPKPSIGTPSVEEPLTTTEDGIVPSVPLCWQATRPHLLRFTIAVKGKIGKKSNMPAGIQSMFGFADSSDLGSHSAFWKNHLIKPRPRRRAHAWSSGLRGGRLSSNPGTTSKTPARSRRSGGRSPR